METAVPLALSLRAICRTYVAGRDGCFMRVRALDRVDLDVACGECVELVGDAGAGKSTLLLCAAGLLMPDTGEMAWPMSAPGRTGAPPRGSCAYVAATLRPMEMRAARASLAAPYVRLALIDLDLRGNPGGAEYDSSLLDDLLGDLTRRGVAALVACRAPVCAAAARRVTIASGRIVHDTANAQAAAHAEPRQHSMRSAAARVAERVRVDANSIDPDSSRV